MSNLTYLDPIVAGYAHQQPFISPSTTLHIITGTFNTIALYILAFDTLTRTLSVSSRVDAFGPHQYLARDPSSRNLFATSWAIPPKLTSWAIGNDGSSPSLALVNQANITATSSYITATETHIYSVGGPTGEVHLVDPQHGGFGEKVQRLLYVDPEDLGSADKTRKALRYGSHGIEFDSNSKAYVPDLGRNSIWVYDRETDGRLTLLDEVKSPREGDAPRHAVPSPDGKCLYSVTEHTSFVDVYETTEKGLKYIQSASILPPGSDPHDYRGDTIRLSRTSPFLFATTRGSTPTTKGYLTAFPLDPTSGQINLSSSSQGAAAAGVARFVTPTSGGKANAIEVVPVRGRGREGERDWIVLTDDEEGLVLVVGWDGERFEEVSRVRLPDGALASHAIWLE